MTAPSASTNRIVAIDLLRGFALLGILSMNIMSFSMPDAAYSNPTLYGGEGINLLVYGFVHIMADQKFMALFSMLFGASVMLLLSKSAQQGKKATRVHYVRNGWLLFFGLLHGIFVWQGDVLLVYALCSFFLFFFKNLKPSLQISLGLLVFFLPSLLSVFVSTQLSSLDLEAQQVLSRNFTPSAQELAEDIAVHKGAYAEQLSYRFDSEETSSTTQDLLDVSFLLEAFARAFGMMLLGMAFYTLGILTAQRSKFFYKRMLLFGFLIGIPLASVGLYLYYVNNWDAAYALFLGRIPNHLATPFIACAYLALVMLWSQTAILKTLQNRLAAVGRMALSNYISQSLLATIIFYGFGLGLYGNLNRLSQSFIVLLIWALQLVISAWWLKHFRYGPLEWLWRSLTYFRLEPFRKAH